MRRLLALVAIVTVVLAACGGDTSDDPLPLEPDGGTGDGAEPPGSPYPVADLTITIEHPDAETVEYRVTCLSDTATITGIESLSGETACSRLAEPAVQARLASPPPERVCTEIYGGPDVARMDGTIDGRPIATTIDRTDGCGISDWDNLLAGVLPAALGVTD